MRLLKQVPEITFFKIPCRQNSAVDALAKLAKEISCPDGETNPIKVQGRRVLFPASLENLNTKPASGKIALTYGEEILDWRRSFV